jgi:hypothetical protein
MDAEQVLERLTQLMTEEIDENWSNGDNENSWLSFTPNISEQLLRCFEQVLQLGVDWAKEGMAENCGHENCAVRHLSESPFGTVVPVTTMLAIIRELIGYRGAEEMATVGDDELAKWLNG